MILVCICMKLVKWISAKKNALFLRKTIYKSLYSWYNVYVKIKRKQKNTKESKDYEKDIYKNIND